MQSSEGSFEKLHTNNHIKDIHHIRNEEFGRLQDNVYLDHAGATLYAKSQILRYQEDLLKNVYGNPHSKNISSRLTADSIDRIRYRVLSFFNTSSDKYTVIFTSGCTGGLKLLAESFSFGHSSKIQCSSPTVVPQQHNGVEVNQDSHNEKIQDYDNFHASDLKDHDGVCSLQSNGAEDNASCSSGLFSYLDDNHTSVVGMREIAAERGVNVVCISADVINNDRRCEQTICEQAIHITPKFIHSKLSGCCGNCLFAYPAQSNFSGCKYSLDWIESIKHNALDNYVSCHGNWFILLDAAGFVGTSVLDLNRYHPDFVTISFYKIFGFPTGLGALLVKNSSAGLLKKSYFGGGTVAVSATRVRFHISKQSIAEKFEDGTLSYLDIISLKHGFDILEELTGGMKYVSQHTFTLARDVHHCLSALRHENGAQVALIYSDTDFDHVEMQGPVISFNLRRSNGDFIGFSEVDKMAQLHSIQIRTGCFCNVGACQRFLELSTQQIKEHFKAGHSCGDDTDLINGIPTGAVRISFGYMSTLDDAQKFMNFISDCFVEKGVKQSSICVSELVNPVGKRILSGIYIYPVKSCAGFQVHHWKIATRGFMYDREWMIVTDTGVCLNQKREARLCFIKPEIDISSGTLRLKCDGLPDLHIPLSMGTDQVQAQVCQSKVCGDRVSCIDCGDEAAEWLSKALSRDGCRLIRQLSDNGRIAKTKATEQTSLSQLSLANQSQFLLITTASVEKLLHVISTRNSHHLEVETLMARFRANLVIDTSCPFEEDSWENVTIGNLNFFVDSKCSRCQMVCLDQKTGERSKEPLLTLSQMRGKQMPFGVYLRHNYNVLSEETAEATIGDELTGVGS